MPTPIHSPALNLPRIRHGFFTREGGVSEGIYAGLNCGPGSGDNTAHIQENRARVSAYFGQEPAQLVTLYQAHTNEAVIVHAPFDGIPPQADALVTATPGLVLGILTADCGPLLLADTQAGVIGAAHAGWKGAFSGIIEATVKAMLSLGARKDHIVSALGPCIAQRSYEVGPEFVARFEAEHGLEAHRFFSPSVIGDKALFDLKQYIRFRLQHLVSHTLNIIDCDTCTDSERFYSYRRATLKGEPSYGRLISCIMLEPGIAL